MNVSILIRFRFESGHRKYGGSNVPNYIDGLYLNSCRGKSTVDSKLRKSCMILGDYFVICLVLVLVIYTFNEVEYVYFCFF